MSTKIYTGVCLDTGDLLTNWRLLGACKSPIQQLVDAKHRRVLARRLCDKADLWTLGLSGAGSHADAMHENAPGTWRAQWDKEREEIPWLDEQRRLLAEQRQCRASDERAPDVDCDVQLFLRVHPTRGAVLGYLQEERVGAYEQLLALEGFSEYGYWNNTDAPESLTPDEWCARRQAWDVVFQEDVACVTLQWEPAFTFPQELAPVLPSLAERAQRLSLEELRHKSLEKAYAERTNPQSASMSWVMSCLRRLQEALAEPQSELSLRHARRTEELKGLLVEDLGPKLTEPWSRWVPGA